MNKKIKIGLVGLVLSAATVLGSNQVYADRGGEKYAVKTQVENDTTDEAIKTGLKIGLYTLGSLGAAYFISRGFRIIKQAEKATVERFGKYNRTLEPGLRWVIPLVEKVRRVSLKEIIIDVPKQHVITSDNVGVNIDGLVGYKIEDPYKALYAVLDVNFAMTQISQTNLRSIIGRMHLDETLSGRLKINEEMKTTLNRESDAWGVDVIRAEIKEILTPEDITKSMNKQMIAERDKRATIIDSEGRLEAAKNDAKAAKEKAAGEKEAEIQRAEGKAKAITLEADAKAGAIRAVNESAEAYFKGNAVDFRKLEVAESVLKNNSKFFIPQGTSLAAIISDTDAKVVPVEKK
ncbi:hypothetical protein HYX19_00045 [Candidatus Woesearchaeota archaeon]|nr:hypothetical protein [Candidatus Woesearchaeota archaeon]